MSNECVSEYKYPLQGWMVIVTASLFFFYEFLQMTMFNSISSELMAAFNITGAKFGVLAAGYFYANVIFLFPAGIILDRFSTRKLILAALLLCVASTFGMAFAHNFSTALLARFLIGTSSTLCFLSIIRLASRWFPTNKMALATGVIVTIMALGGFMGQTPLSLLVQSMGWRHALLLDGCLGIIFWIIIFYNVFDFPPSYHTAHHENLRTLKELGFWTSIGKALSSIQNWLCGLYTSLLNLSVFIIGSSFGTLFLMQIHHFSATKASFVSSMIFLGMIFGCPIIGGFSDRIGKRKLPMIVCALISLLLVMVLVYSPTLNYGMLLLLVFAIGFFTSAQIISYPLIAETSPKALTSTSISVASVLIMGGGAVFEPLYGYLLNLNWQHITVNGVAQYAASDFHTAFLILPITIVIGTLLILLAKETHCKARD